MASYADIMQMLNDVTYVQPIDAEERAAAQAYIKRRAKVLGWSPEEHVEILSVLFGAPRAIRHKNQGAQPPKETAA